MSHPNHDVEPSGLWMLICFLLRSLLSAQLFSTGAVNASSEVAHVGLKEKSDD